MQIQSCTSIGEAQVNTLGPRSGGRFVADALSVDKQVRVH